jgi:uncharacterized membrane protein
LSRALALAVTAFAAGFGAVAVLRHRSFYTGRFDLGNMTQAVWSTAHGEPLAVTNLAGEQTNRLASHFDPILALFAPLWLLWPSPEMLLVTQAIAIALGALPVYWLARKHLDSERAGLGFSLAYLLFPATQWLALSEFHPVALACPLLLFAFWFLDEDRLVPFAVCAALACTTKEEIALAVAGLGLWYALARRRRVAGITIAIAGAAAAALALGVVGHYNDGGDPFAGRYVEVGGSPTGILKTLVTDPLTIVRAAFDLDGLTYLLVLLVPLAFLPLAAPLALLPALPDLALNLLSSTDTQTSIHFHYVAPLVPALFAAAIFAAARFNRPIAKPLVALVLVSNFVLGAIPLWGAIPGGEGLQANAALVSDHDRTATRALRLIPGDAVVSASNSLGAHLSDRRRFLSFPIRADATWIAVDERSPGYLDRFAPGPYAIAIARLRRDPDWKPVFDEDGVLVFRRESSAEAGTP